MIRKNKKYIAVLLSAALTLSGLTPVSAAKASETEDIYMAANSVNDEYTVKETEAVDGSDMLLQEGGFNILSLEDLRGQLTVADDAEEAVVNGEKSLEDSIYADIVKGLSDREDEIDISSYKVKFTKKNQTLIQDIFFTAVNDNPQLCYCQSSVALSFSDIICSVNPDYYDDMDIDLFNNNVDEATDTIWENIDGGNTEYEPSELDIYLGIHDYLVNNCAYNEACWKTGKADTNLAHSAYGVFVNRDAVCQGYALAYKLLCDRLGLTDCIYVSSDSMKHAWNMVKLGDNYYHIDATWDDPVPNKVGLVSHEFFMVSDEAFGPENSTGRDEHTDWDSRNRQALDTTYDDYYWYSENVGSPILKSDGKYYYVMANTSEGISDDPMYVERDGSSRNAMIQFGKWPAGVDELWRNAYSGNFLYNGRFFFNNSECIMSIAPGESEAVAEYMFNSDERPEDSNIYGIALENGSIHYSMRGMEEASSRDSSKYKPFLLPISSLKSSVKYTVSLETDDGILPEEVSDSFEVVYGERISELPEPSKEGYFFLGWSVYPASDDKAKENMLNQNFIYRYTEDVTFYAIWEECEHTNLIDGSEEIVKASFTDDGYVMKECADCGLMVSVEDIKKISCIQLMEDYRYTGEAIVPDIKLLDADDNEIKADVKRQCTDNIVPGSAKLTVKVADTDEYYTGEQTVSFNIAKALKPSQTPVNISVEIDNGKKVADVTGLLTGWQWKATEADKLLPVKAGAAIEAVAVYTNPKDMDYYENTEAVVIITMIKCNHTYGSYSVSANNTAPTCTESGKYDLVEYCSKCGDTIGSTPVEMPALGHNFVSGKCTRCNKLENEETDKPGSETDKPGSETDKPGSETDKPGSETDKPGSETDKPGDGSIKPTENIAAEDVRIDKQITLMTKNGQVMTTVVIKPNGASQSDYYYPSANGKKVILNKKLTRRGYIFKGWRLNGKKVTTITEKNLTEGAVLEAVFVPVVYQIKYKNVKPASGVKVIGKISLSSSEKKVSYDKKTFVTKGSEISADGYVLKGFTNIARGPVIVGVNETAELDKVIPSRGKNIILYPVWEKK